MKTILKPYIELARPFTLIAPLIGFFAGGLCAWGKYDFAFEWARIYPLLLGALMAATLNIASNAINQIYDIKIDKINKPTRPLCTGEIGLGMAWVYTVVFALISLGFAWLAAPSGAGSHECFYIVLVAMFFVYAYSGPPFRTKRWGLAANSTITIPRGLLLPIAGWSSVATVREPEPWFLGLVFCLFILGAATTKDFADMVGDEKEGCITLPIKYGIKAAAWMTAPFLIFPFVLFPVEGWLGYLSASPMALTVLGVGLALYGTWVSYLILRRPEELATEANHISWKHMYLLMILGQLGVIVCYWV